MPPFLQDEMGPHMGGPGGCGEGDQMTPEQVAWLKLQQEFYEEKRKKQEMQHRPLPPDMMMHPHGPRGMMRGQISSLPDGPRDGEDCVVHTLRAHEGRWHGPWPPRGMPHTWQRMPGLPGMMNLR
ncbi:B-cell CLL/lymphoma 9 protein [Lates japonicus]|uniref:B-cell CLL/lymphoma 9 protein n=1 Tax=Lates japonicus TaxID=270547 RepID=A0AAD3NLV7_LATJO|nr:B-cell CLL/lymphoma 9 protein [Lates japonicus]